ncbi:MAG TPA: family 20 glycosylhydrolase [Verrucomicrobiae bacterium]|nr:family 20 glycosylhydrolase [Verrucomicrobiae bacterium]
MKLLKFLLPFLLIAFLVGCQTPETSETRASSQSAWTESWRAQNPVWRGVHLSVQSDRQADQLVEQLPRLKADGVNVIIAEVDYSFDFKTHPQLRDSRYITRPAAQRLAKAARENGTRLIPQINCLGHQSWSSNTLPLLVKYPQFDETPGKFPHNKGIYCRSWCPLNPDVKKVMFACVDELIDAFDADAFHVGMDEVFIIGSEYCPRCHGKDPSKLFAKAVNDFHRHIVGKKKIEMLMWGDRLLDAKALGYSEWEASTNGTYRTIDHIPKDIIICDWHYEKQTNYASVPLLLSKGFRVWPSGWQPLENSEAFSAYSQREREENPRLIGYLCTTWGKAKISNAADWPPIVDVLKDWK